MEIIIDQKMNRALMLLGEYKRDLKELINIRKNDRYRLLSRNEFVSDFEINEIDVDICKLEKILDEVDQFFEQIT